jgi:hypothetical protein
MSQNQEIIESKLCAYIDGELDPEGRAEIEKHLEANPQHRRLLESLRATRDLLRWLPREPAPAEIAETLNGQLERSVLLNYEGEQLGPSIWPKVFAAAAIVALTAGLGVAVYYALPKSQSPAQLALHTAVPESGNADVVPAPLATTEESPRSDIAAKETGVDREHNTYASKVGPSAMADKDQVAVATPPAAPSLADNIKASAPAARNEKKSAELDQLVQQVAQNPGAFVAAAGNASNSVALNTSTNAIQNGNTAGSSPLVLLVKSDAPEQTEKQLTASFNEQQIAWRQVPLTFQAEGSLQQSRPAMPAHVNENVMRRGANTDYRSLGRPAKGAEEPAPQAAGANAAPAVTPAVPATQPAASGVAVAGKAESPNDALAQQQPQNVPASQLQQEVAQAALTNNIRSDGVYVCQMSRRQAAQLSNTIANSTNPPAQVQDLSNQANNSVNALANESQASVNASAPPAQFGAAGGFGGGGALNTQRDRSMKSAAGGLEGERAAKPSAADATDKDTAAARPASAPNNAAGLEASASQPAPAEAINRQPAPATTQPAQWAASPTTAPADEPVNVVIMVQSNPAPPNAAAAPAPATPRAPEAQSQPQLQQQPATTAQSQQQAK